MTTNRAIILFLAIALVVTAANLPCWAAQQKKEEQKKEENIWTEGEQRGPALGPERGPERGRGPGGPERRGPSGPPRFELTDDEVNRIINSLKQSDPNMAKQLAELRNKDPERFIDEIRKHAGTEFDRVMRERIEKWRSTRRTEFLDWLGKTVPKAAEELAKLKENDPNLYAKKYELTWQKYNRIFDQARMSPELAEVNMADLELQQRQESLCSKIKSTQDEKEKAELLAQLQEVVNDRYDLSVKRKQIAYKWLLQRLDSLQKQVKESMEDIERTKDPKVKEENVKERIKYLTEGSSRFRWD